MQVVSCDPGKTTVSPKMYNACAFEIIDKWNEKEHAKTCDTMFYLSNGTGAYVWNCDEWLFLDFSGYTAPDWNAKENQQGHIKNKPFEKTSKDDFDVISGVLSVKENIKKPDWENIQNKPYEDLGNGLSVDEDGNLIVTVTAEDLGAQRKLTAGKGITINENDAEKPVISTKESQAFIMGNGETGVAISDDESALKGKNMLSFGPPSSSNPKATVIVRNEGKSLDLTPLQPYLKAGKNIKIDETTPKAPEISLDGVFVTPEELEQAKYESSANVIDQIGGATSAILKDELLIDGTEGTASRYIKDIPSLPVDSPLYDQYGVVPGQPNLVNYSDFTKATDITDLKKGWVLASELEIEVDNGVTVKSSNVTEVNYNRIYPSATNFNFTAGKKYAVSLEIEMVKDSSVYVGLYSANLGYTATYTGTHTIIVEVNNITTLVGLNIVFKTANVQYKLKRIKVIEGSLAAMDEWTPSQADSGLTPVNNGMVPFTNDEYATLLSEDGIVRSETNIVGRGAGIEVPFDVIGTLEKRHPYLFEGLETTAEKKARYLELVKKETILTNSRGGGLSGSTESNFCRLYFRHWNRETWYGSSFTQNSTNQLVEKTEEISSWFRERCFDGLYTFSITSKQNSNTDSGRISDGITPAWVEVKDIRLIVELNVNGRTIIEQIANSVVAANRGTFVTLSEPETIDSLKNFTETPTVNSDPLVVSQDMPAECYVGAGVQTPDNPSSTLFSMGEITGVDFFHKGKDFEMASDGKSVLIKRDMTLYISPTLETRGSNNTIYTDFTYCSVQVGDGTNNGATNTRYQVISVGTDVGSNLLNLTHTKAGHVVADVKAGQKISALVQCRDGKLVWNMTFKGMHLREMAKPIKNGGQ